jgi:Transposase
MGEPAAVVDRPRTTHPAADDPNVGPVHHRGPVGPVAGRRPPTSPRSSSATCDAFYRFGAWCALFADVPEIRALADTIDTWWPEIEAFLRRNITNARTEGSNLAIKTIKRTGRGFTNQRLPAPYPRQRDRSESGVTSQRRDRLTRNRAACFMLDEGMWTGRLEDEPARVGSQRRNDVLIHVKHHQDQYSNLRCGRHDPSSGADPITGHRSRPHGQQHRIRRVASTT